MTEIQQAALEAAKESNYLQETRDHPMFNDIGQCELDTIEGFFRSARWMEEKMKKKIDGIQELYEQLLTSTEKVNNLDEEGLKGFFKETSLDPEILKFAEETIDMLHADSENKWAIKRRDDRWCQFAAAAISGWLASMEHRRSDSNISESMCAEECAMIASALLAEMDKRQIK